MKFQQTEHFTEKSSSVSGQNFNVALSAKMFETLFSNMYRYKEAAVVRELISNKYDAHNMRDRLQRIMPSHYLSVYARQKERFSKFLAPFGTKGIVHLPDMYEPYLEVKDFGVGLHIDDIIGPPIRAKIDELLIVGNIVVKETEIPEGSKVIGEPGYLGDELVFRTSDNEIIRAPGLYTTIFNSTKAEDNDQIGAYGLGSKSPFAVTDSFTVESRFEGKIHRFLMYLNESRIPCADLITKDMETRDPKPLDTDEYNGLTVNVPIRASQYHKFAEQLSSLCRVMELKDLPIITNASHMGKIDQIDRSHRVYDTYIQSKNSADYGSQHYAVMGGVAYPIDITQLATENNNLLKKFPSTYTFFPLGAMNVPPSREDITYDEFGRNALNKKIGELRTGLMNEALLDVEQAYRQGPIKAYYARQKYSEWYGAAFAKLLDVKFPRDERISNDGVIYEPELKAIRDHNSKHNKKSYDQIIGRKSIYTLTKFTDIERSSNILLKVSLSEEPPIFVIHDDSKTYIQKIKGLTSKEKRTVILVTPHNELLTYRNSKLRSQYSNSREIRKTIREWVGTKKEIDYLNFADKFSEYHEGLIGTDIRFMSEIPYVKPVMAKNQSIGLERIQRTSSGGNPTGVKWKVKDIEEAIENNQRIIYVEMSGHDIIHQMEVNGEDIPVTTKMIMDLQKAITCDVNSLKYEYSIAKENGYYPGVFTAKKMSMPFLRKHSEFFVPLDVAMKEMFNVYSDLLKGIEYKRFSGLTKKFKFAQNNAFYLKWVLEQLNSNYTDPGVSEILDKVVNFQKNAGEARNLTSVYEKENVALMEPHKQIFNLNKDEFTWLSNCLTPVFKIKGMETEYHEIFNILERHKELSEQVAGLLGFHEDVFIENKNTGSVKYYRRYKTKLDSRKLVRSYIEIYLLKQFVVKNYQGKMGNKLEGPGEHTTRIFGILNKLLD